jgi:hypothetical protein
LSSIFRRGLSSRGNHTLPLNLPGCSGSGGGEDRITTFNKEEILKTKYLQYLAVLSTLALLFPLGALARDNSHSVDISDVVQIGGTQLKPGNYKVEWQGDGPAVQVSFQHNGKTVVTVPATLKTNDAEITRDAIRTEATSADTATLKEIDFGHHKEALVFDQNPGGM